MYLSILFWFIYLYLDSLCFIFDLSVLQVIFCKYKYKYLYLYLFRVLLQAQVQVQVLFHKSKYLYLYLLYLYVYSLWILSGRCIPYHHNGEEANTHQRCAGHRFLTPRGAHPVCFAKLAPPTPVVNSSECPPNPPTPRNPHTRPARPRTNKSFHSPARPVDLTTRPVPPRENFFHDIFWCFLLRVTQLIKKFDFGLRVTPHHFCCK